MESTTSSLPSTEPQATAATTEPGTRSLPPITTSSSPDYAARFNNLVARIFVQEALTKVLRLEAERPADGIVTEAHVHSSYALRISSKLGGGSVIVEAGDWAAAAIWDPPGTYLGASSMSAEEERRRPIFVRFMRDIREAKARFMGDTARYWHLAMMARDPRKGPVRGAVRAVIEPYLRRAREDGLPVWIEAASPRARDVYGWLGFEVLEEIRSGKGTFTKDGNLPKDGEAAEGVSTWFMIYNRQKRVESEQVNGEVRVG